MSAEQSMSLDDVQVVCALDACLSDAIRLWTQRPAPAQRLARISFAKTFTAFWKKLSEEERSGVFPETKRVFDGALARLKL